MKIDNKLTITILFCLIFGSIRSVKAGEKIVIDTDAGGDDAVAILLLLKNEFRGYEIAAITCTYGNTDVDNVVQNVLKTLTVANRSDIPVYRGATKALIKPYTPSEYFGSDGFGDFAFTEEIVAKVDESKHAAVALVDLVKKYPGEITLLNLGPLTNTALAAALDPSFLKNLKEHIIMGSSVSGVGNMEPNVEFNFGQDPESNNIVLNNTKRSILFPWETVLASAIPMDWRLNVLGKLNSTLTNFINKAEKTTLSKNTTWTAPDSMTASLIIWPDFITKSVVTNVSPVFTGEAKGSILVDYTNKTSKPRNAEVVQSFNVDAFQQVLLAAFS